MSEPDASAFSVYQSEGTSGEDSLVEVVEYYSTVLAEVDIAIDYTLLQTVWVDPCDTCGIVVN